MASACIGALVTGSAAAASCPNEALRVGPSALLPECRAYEMVSPPNKGDGFVDRRYADQSAVTGDRIAFLSTSAFGDAESAPSFSVYLAQREGSTGWSTANVDPPVLNTPGLLEIASTAFSSDLGQTLQTNFVEASQGATEGHSNVFVRNNLTGVRTPIASASGEELFLTFEYGEVYAGGSSDWSHLVLKSTAPLIEGLAPGTLNVYDYTGGHFEVIDRLANGEIPPQGATIPVGEHNGVAANGSRVFFTLGSTAGGPIYMREDDRTTVPISISQKEGPEEGEVKGANFVGASADGSIAYFTSNANLTDASHTHGSEHGSETLYRFSLASGKVTDLTPTAESAADGVFAHGYGTSQDGSFVYFGARAALAPGATEASPGGTNLYVWHNGTISFIAQTSHLAASDGSPSRELISPNGEHFAFVTTAPLTSSDVASPNCPATNEVPEHCAQVYEYEYAGQLTCVSCSGPARGDSSLTGEAKTSTHTSRGVLDNGSVFFNSPNKLVGEDSNGVGDVYLWRDGVTSLISTGTSGQSSIFADATADGSNAYLLTDQRLVGIDTDSGTDIYDAKVDGGLAVQNPPGSSLPCEGEACRGASPLAPPSPLSGASAHRGDNCARLSRLAHLDVLAAKRAGRHARSASGSHAAHLRKVASRRHADARRAHSEARRCRRAGR